MQHFIDNKTIFITGAAGSIGSEIVRQLCTFNPKKLVLIDQAETPLYNLQQEILIQFPDSFNLIDYQISNIRCPETIDYIFNIYKPDVVFHAAAYKHVPLMENNPFSAVENNIFGTINLAKTASRYNCEKFVMISTDKAVRPTNVMGATKRIAEVFCQSLNFSENNKTKFITTRFGNVLGSNGSVIPLFRQQIEKGGPITVTHKDITRYFMSIPEACHLVIEAGAMGNGGEIFLFDMGEPIKIVDLATKMILLSGNKPDIDIKIEFTGLRPGEKLYEELLISGENLTKTHHPKIRIAQVNPISYDIVEEQMHTLKQVFNLHDSTELVKQLKHIEPDYKSNNSIYEKLDVINN